MVRTLNRVVLVPPRREGPLLHMLITILAVQAAAVVAARHQRAAPVVREAHGRLVVTPTQAVRGTPLGPVAVIAHGVLVDAAGMAQLLALAGFPYQDLEAAVEGEDKTMPEETARTASSLCVGHAEVCSCFSVAVGWCGSADIIRARHRCP